LTISGGEVKGVPPDGAQHRKDMETAGLTAGIDLSLALIEQDQRPLSVEERSCSGHRRNDRF